MIRKSIFISVFSLLCLGAGIAQTLEEEIGFIYVKAEYLFETSRYDEAVTQYNLVIRQDPKYKDALIKRGMAKNALGAYKGGKQDALQSIELKGITGLAAATLAKAELGLNQSEAAFNSLSAAIGLLPSDADLLELRARIYETDGQLLKACADYERAMYAGSAVAEAKARSLCGITKKAKNNTGRNNNTKTETESGENPIPADNNAGNIGGPENTNEGNTSDNETRDTSDVKTNPAEQGEEAVSESDVTEVKDDPTIPKEDNTRNTLQIDDDLVIEIYGQGLGKRKIEEIPSILILADEDGTVCLDICVDNKGNVTKAEFNPGLSTTAKKSMVSLAIRKSREFSFEPAIFTTQCGVMVFKIKGS